MKSRWSLYLCVAILCGVAMVNAIQADRFAAAQARLSRLEKTQSEWLASNKQAIAGIAVLSATYRIETLATHELKLQKLSPEAVTRITISPPGTIDG